MTPETRYARTTDRTHVAYQAFGEGPFDLLVLRSWHSNIEHEWAEPVLAGVFRRLASLGRVLLLDRRGTGLSDPIDPNQLPTLEDRIDDIRAVMAAVGAERVVPIGLAHGAGLCAVFAATHPERTAGLVLWAPPWSVVRRAPDDQVAQLLDVVSHDWATLEAAHETVRHGGPSRKDDAAFVEWIRNNERLTGSVEAAVAQARLLIETNVDDVLPAIHVPTLVAWRRDSPGAESARYVARRIPHAVTREMPGIDHMFIAGDWRTPLREFEDFIESLAGDEADLDRVLATVMFTDLVGSTQRAAELGDRAWRDLVERHHALVRRELARHRGREIDTAGDGFFAAFDGPARAIRCALAIHRAVRELGLALRIGLHAGECERAGTGLRGMAVHIGARVAGLAGASEVLVTSTVRDLVAGSGLTFEDRGRHQLKGVPAEWQIFAVDGVEPNPD
jgi:class 3 adenylate cyclase/alpha-beta hydrolase superfamily lysophospholipase